MGTITATIQTALPRTKLAADQFTPEIAPLALAELIDLVAELGIAPERLCADVGVTVADMCAGELISNRQAWRLFRRAMQLTGRSDLGLELGRRQNISHFGLPGYAMTAARTFGEAIDIGVRYQRQGGGLVDVSYQLQGDLAVLIATPRLHDPMVHICVIEELFASLIVLIHILLGDSYRFEAIDLTYPPPAHAPRYAEIFQCPAHFGQPHNRILLPRAWLELPLASHSTVAAAQLRSLLEERARSHQTPNAVAAVEHVLKQAGSAVMSLENVSEALDLSPRTLRRRLSEAGTSFHALSERLLAEQARHLLRDEGLTVAEAGRRLGFSDARAFRRAFKRWLGEAPGAMRRRAPESSLVGDDSPDT
ncbi:AraC family transcriptional regulator [Rhodanobacter sp. BL-MT-08]